MNGPRKKDKTSIFILGGVSLFGACLILLGIFGEDFIGVNQVLMIIGCVFLALGVVPLILSLVLTREPQPD
jgi:hypothetical protein